MCHSLTGQLKPYRSGPELADLCIWRPEVSQCWARASQNFDSTSNSSHDLAHIMHGSGSQRFESTSAPVLAQSRGGHWPRPFTRGLPEPCARAMPDPSLIFLPVVMLWQPDQFLNCARTGIRHLVPRAMPEPYLMFLSLVMSWQPDQTLNY